MRHELLLPGRAKSRRPWLLALAIIGLAVAGLAAAFALGVWHMPAPRLVQHPGTEVMLPRVEPVEYLKVAPDTARELNAQRPIEIASPVAARSFAFTGDDQAQERAVACLAAAAWYEAGDDAVGQDSVIQVVLNRTRHPAFPNTICGVVFQGSDRPTGCQFTFTCDGALGRTPSAAAWQRAIERARAMLKGRVEASVGWSTHYHADWVVPYWASDLTKAAKVETHIFYLWRGYWGTPAAFRRRVETVEPVVPQLARLSQAHAERGALTLDLAAPAEQTAPALAPEKPPLVLEGVSKRSLGTAQVRAQHKDQNQFFVQLDGKAFPGSFAISALAICKGKPRCTVLGWQDGAQIAQGLPLSEAQRSAITFLYARDEAKGERALWNCAQFDRPNKAQCLPVAKPALDALIH